MTIQSQTTRVDYTGNGATKNFPVPFYWLQDTDLLVIRTDSAYTPPTVATLALTTDYVVTGSGNQSGGSITTAVAPTATQKLSILRNVPFTQLTHYVPNDPFPAASHEQALDKLTMETQQLNEGLSRSITLPPNATGLSTNLPLPAASNLIGWNATANALQNVDPTTIATSVTYGNAVADKFSGDGATVNFNLSANPGGINNLDVSIGGVTQRPGIDYTWTSGTTLTFTSAPPAGTNNVLARYTQALPVGLLGVGQVTATNLAAGSVGNAALAANAVKDVNVDPAAAIQSTKLAFLASGTGAVQRTVQAKDSDVISVKDFGAVGDGVTVDTAAFAAAVAAYPGRAIFVPDPTVNYVLDATITLPANTTLYGQGKFSTKVFKKGNNDMFKLGDGAGIQNMWLDGQGATNTGGRGVVIGAINTTDGHQNLVNVRVVNFPVDCVAFTDVNAGSQFIATNCEFNQYGAATGSNRFAVTIVDASQLGAVPRAFVGCQFNGTPSFNFGGCNDLFISGCFLGDLNYTLNSRSVQIANSRISNQAALSIYGHNHTIVGCDVNPQITLTFGVDNCHFGPNSLNNAPIIDNSGNGRNQLYQWTIAYTPTLSTGGTAPSLGNGTLNGRWSRQGSTVHVTVSLTIGSTTSLGTGQLQFSLPSAAPNTLDITQVCGSIQMYHAPSTNNTGVCVVPATTNVVQLLRDTSGAVTFNSPQTWAAGDIIVATFSYDVGA